MFKLIAFLFLASNPEPVTAMTYNQVEFPSKEACMAFGDTETGKAAMEQVEAIAEKHSYKVKYACVKAEDNTI